MYAQRNEDDITLQWFGWAKDPDGQLVGGKKDGRFLDIGAYDAKIFSQTRALYDRGWSGVMVEASAGRFRSLMEAYKNDKRITLVNAAITGNQSGLMRFWQNDDATSTADEGHKKVWEGTSPFVETFTLFTTYAHLVGVFPEPYDFINIDVEGGLNLAIFRAVLAQGTSASLICVEYDTWGDEILSLAKPHGYTEVHRTAENLLLGRR
jgi:FkbM family methyltransferase